MPCGLFMNPVFKQDACDRLQHMTNYKRRKLKKSAGFSECWVRFSEIFSGSISEDGPPVNDPLFLDTHSNSARKIPDTAKT